MKLVASVLWFLLMVHKYCPVRVLREWENGREVIIICWYGAIFWCFFMLFLDCFLFSPSSCALFQLVICNRIQLVSLCVASSLRWQLQSLVVPRVEQCVAPTLWCPFVLCLGCASRLISSGPGEGSFLLWSQRQSVVTCPRAYKLCSSHLGLGLSLALTSG